jgi:hypothetical protein
MEPSVTLKSLSLNPPPLFLEITYPLGGKRRQGRPSPEHEFDIETTPDLTAIQQRFDFVFHRLFE